MTVMCADHRHHLDVISSSIQHVDSPEAVELAGLLRQLVMTSGTPEDRARAITLSERVEELLRARGSIDFWIDRANDCALDDEDFAILMAGQSLEQARWVSDTISILRSLDA